MVKSLEERRRVYPVVAGMAKKSPLWQALGYTPRERNKTIGFEEEVAFSPRSFAISPVTLARNLARDLARDLARASRRRLSHALCARQPLGRPIGVPAEAHADAFAAAALRTPLLTLPLCAPYDEAAAKYLAFVESSTRRGLPLSIAAAAGRPMRHGSLAIAPAWLASLSGAHGRLEATRSSPATPL